MTPASNPWAALMTPLLRRPGDALPAEDMTEEELDAREARRLVAWRAARASTPAAPKPAGDNRPGRPRPLSTACFNPQGCGRRNCRVCNP